MTEQRQTTILLVEDERIVALSESAFLTGAGYRVLTVGSGEQAITAVRDNSDIDLILMDIDLGAGIDGTEAARQILNDSEIPIVFVTSHAEQEMVSRVKNITRYGYVLKNAGEFVLQEAISMALDLFASHRGLAAREEWLRTVVESLPQEFWAVDREYRYVMQNSSSKNHIGDMTGKPIDDVPVPQRMKAQWREIDRRALAGEQVTASYHYETENGTRYIRSTIAPLRVHGQIEAIIGLTEDVTRRTLAEEQLRIERDLSEKLLDTAPIGVAIVSSRGRILFANRAATVMFGVEDPDALPDHLEDPAWVFTNVDGEPVSQELLPLQRVLATHSPVIDARHSLKAPNGALVPLSINGAPVLSAGGEIERIVFTFRDLTEELHHEREAERATARYKALVEHAPEAIVVFEAQTMRIVEVNSRAESLYHLSREELIEKTPLDVSPVRQPDGATSEQAARRYVEATLSGELPVFEWTHIRGDERELVTTEVRLVRLPGEDPVLIRATVTDLLERNRREIEVRESEAKLRSVLKTLPDMVYEIKEDGTFSGYHGSPELHPLVPPQRFLGQRMDSILPTEVVATTRRAISAALSTGELQRYSYQLVKDGTVHHFEARMSRLAEDRVVVVVRDQSERVRAEQEAQQLVREQQLLISEIHHRVKNDMMSLQALMSLHRGAPKREQTDATLTEIGLRIGVMRRIYERIYRRSDLSTLDLGKLVSDLMQDARTAFNRGTEVVLSSKIDSVTIPAVMGFPVGIIVTELMTNAFKYAFAQQQGGTIVANAERDGRWLRLSITDDGDGATPEVTSGEEHGFGLNLINSIAERYNGALELHSRGGVTASVTLQLPPEQVS